MTIDLGVGDGVPRGPLADEADAHGPGFKVDASHVDHQSAQRLRPQPPAELAFDEALDLVGGHTPDRAADRRDWLPLLQRR